MTEGVDITLNSATTLSRAARRCACDCSACWHVRLCPSAAAASRASHPTERRGEHGNGVTPIRPLLCASTSSCSWLGTRGTSSWHKADRTHPPRRTNIGKQRPLSVHTSGSMNKADMEQEWWLLRIAISNISNVTDAGGHQLTSVEATRLKKMGTHKAKVDGDQCSILNIL